MVIYDILANDGCFKDLLRMILILLMLVKITQSQRLIKMYFFYWASGLRMNSYSQYIFSETCEGTHQYIWCMVHLRYKSLPIDFLLKRIWSINNLNAKDCKIQKWNHHTNYCYLIWLIPSADIYNLIYYAQIWSE